MAKKTSKNVKKHRLKVFGVHISPMVDSSCGKDVKIKPEEYRYNGECKPSRNVKLVHAGDSITLGIVKEVPKRPKADTTPPAPGMRRSEAGGRSQKEEVPASKEDYYKQLPEGVMVEWDSRNSKLRLNQTNPFIQKYFITGNNFVHDSPRHRRVKELYTSWYAQAYSLAQVFEKTDPEPQIKDEAWEDDFLNYTLNQLIHAGVTSDPQILRQIDQIEKKLDAPEAHDEDE